MKKFLFSRLHVSLAKGISKTTIGGANIRLNLKGGRFFLVLFFSIPTFFWANVQAQVTWDGGAGTNKWGDAANWSDNTVPGASTNVDLSFPTSITISVVGSYSINDLTLNDGVTLIIDGVLTVSNFVQKGGNVEIINPTGVAAGGGTISTVGSYTQHVFTSSGTFQVFKKGDQDEMQVLVVAGGGGGGCGNGGGGGAGGLLYDSAFTLVSGSSYSVVVGAGGAGSSNAALVGVNGSNSSFGGFTAIGGGGGGSTHNRPGSNGGCGGGAGEDSSFSPGTSSQTASGSFMFYGTNGAIGGRGLGFPGGGGGGAGSNGSRGYGTTGNAGVLLPGNGGVGVQIFGSWFAGGGGAGFDRSNAGTGPNGSSGGQGGGGAGSGVGNGSSGTAYTGGGGGGGGSGFGTRYAGGSGGSGVVIVRYLNRGSAFIVNGSFTYTDGNFDFGDTLTWDGGASSSAWTDSLNWSTDKLPGSNSIVKLNAASFTSINLKGVHSILGLVLEDSVLLTIDTGSALMVNGNFIQSGGELVKRIAKGASAIGGTITSSGGYRYHTFTSAGEFQVLQSDTMQVLIVGGGGGGGCGNGGGGGGGGVLFDTAFIPSLTSRYAIIVGSGGNGSTSQVSKGSSGGSTSFGSYTAVGGGGGGSTGNATGLVGGSGGGASEGGVAAGGSSQSSSGNFTAYGNNGSIGGSNNGFPGGGGGGAGAIGTSGLGSAANAGTVRPGAGGNGLNIWGTYYAAGGGAGHDRQNASNTGPTGSSGGLGGGGNGSGVSTGTNATAYTGSGGGGGGSSITSRFSGGNGASGLVKVRYRDSASIFYVGGNVVFEAGVFPHETLTWDGEGSTDNWSNPLNWSSNRVPNSLDDVDLSGVSPFDIIMDGDFQVHNLDIGANVSLKLNGGNTLTVNGNYNQTDGVVNLLNSTLCSGGTETWVDGYKVHTFTGNGSLSVTKAGFAQVLVVAGGGGGGRGNGGGGGGGGVLYANAYSLGVGTVNITVGAGGNGSTSDNTLGANGGNSTFGSFTANGGGGGGSISSPIGASGGSGGGAAENSTAGPSNQNSVGSFTGFGRSGGSGGASFGFPGGGGGGAGQLGQAGIGSSLSGINAPIPGNGGAGLNIFGAYYGGGGGAGYDAQNAQNSGANAGVRSSGGNGGGGNGSGTGAGSNGAFATGGGGGGGGSSLSPYARHNGGSGGSGIVIVRYAVSGFLVVKGNYTKTGGYFPSGDSISIKLNGSGNQTLASNNPISISQFVLDNVNGLDISSSPNITVNGSVELKKGTLNLGNKVFTIKGTTLNSSGGKLDASAGTVQFENDMPLIISSDVFSGPVENMTIASNGSSVTVTDTTEIHGVLTLESGTLISSGTIVLKATSSTEYAQVSPDGNGTVSGSIRIEKVLTDSSEGWRHFALPVDGIIDSLQGINKVFASHSISTERNVYYWDAQGSPSNSAIANGWKPASRTDDENRAYVIFGSNNTKGLHVIQPEIYAQGIPNTGSKVFNLNHTTDPGGSGPNATGWNLLPNPYPSNLSLPSFMADIDFQPNYKGVHVWDYLNGQYLAVSSSYVNYNTGGGQISTSSVLAPYQAFWVKSDTTNQSVTLKNAHRVTSSAIQLMKGSTSIFRLQVTDTLTKRMDQFSLAFSDNASSGFDGAHDLLKIRSMASDVPTLYSYSGGMMLSLSALPSQDSLRVPVYMEAAIDGRVYTFSSILAEFNDNRPVYLEDLKTGETVNIRKTFYSFVFDKTYSSQRFVLHFGAPLNTAVSQPLVEKPNFDFYLFQEGDELYVSIDNEEGLAEVTVFNLAGQTLFTGNLSNGKHQLPVTSQQQLILIRVKNSASSLSKKIIF